MPSLFKRMMTLDVRAYDYHGKSYYQLGTATMVHTMHNTLVCLTCLVCRCPHLWVLAIKVPAVAHLVPSATAGERKEWESALIDVVPTP